MTETGDRAKRAGSGGSGGVRASHLAVACIALAVVLGAGAGIAEGQVAATGGPADHAATGSAAVQSSSANDSVEIMQVFPGGRGTDVEVFLENTGDGAVTVTGFAVETDGDLATVDHLDTGEVPAEFELGGITGAGRGHANRSFGDGYATDGTVHSLDRSAGIQPGSIGVAEVAGARDAGGDPVEVGDVRQTTAENADLTLVVEYDDGSRTEVHLRTTGTGGGGDGDGDGDDFGSGGESVEKDETTGDDLPATELWNRTYSGTLGDDINGVLVHDGSAVFAGTTSMTAEDTPTDQIWVGSVDEFTGDLEWTTDWGEHQYDFELLLSEDSDEGVEFRQEEATGGGYAAAGVHAEETGWGPP